MVLAQASGTEYRAEKWIHTYTVKQSLSKGVKKTKTKQQRQQHNGERCKKKKKKSENIINKWCWENQISNIQF